MSWTSGETITASRLEDKNDRNVANGYPALDANALLRTSQLRQTLPAPLVNEWTNESNIDDENVTTYASAGGNDSSVDLVYDLGASYHLFFSVWGNIYAEGTGEYPTALTLAISPDNSNWYPIYSPPTTSTGVINIFSSISGYARYIRIRYSGLRAASYAYIYEASLFY